MFADFKAEMTFPDDANEEGIWIIYVDGSSNSKGSGAGVIVDNSNKIVIELSLGLSFTMTNNTAEYEAYLVGLRVAKDMEAKRVKICTDSQLAASQVSGEFQVQEEHRQEYVLVVQAKIKEFDSVEVEHVLREINTRENILSKLASTRTTNGNITVIQEVLTEPSVQRQKALLHEINVIFKVQDWRGHLIRYISNGELASVPNERTRLK